MSGGIRRYNRPERDFMITHRSFARLSTKQLSMRGRTVGLYVLSHDHGYEQTQKDIARRLDLAVRTVADALKDLEQAGLLVRIPERNARGHRTGTTMHVSDVPFTDEEVADLLGSLPAKSADAESLHADFAGPKESNSKQESKREEEQPSGRAADAAPRPESDPTPEESMPRTAGRQDDSLFPELEKPKRARKERPMPTGAAAVVAAFADSYQQHHATRALKSDLAKVGRDAKLILSREEATEEDLIACAARMGQGEWSNLTQELKFSRRATSGPAVVHAPSPHDSPGWGVLREQTLTEVPEMTVDELNEIFGVKA